MIYALKVIDTISDYSNYSFWHKTTRGYEAWCDNAKTYTDLNKVFGAFSKCSNWKSTFYEVQEYKD